MRGGDADGAAADDGDVARAIGHGVTRRQRGRPPGQRPAAAAMAVIMDDALVADGFDIEARPGGAERTQADGDMGHPPDVHAQRRERAGGQSRGCGARGGGAGGERERGGEQVRRLGAKAAGPGSSPGDR